MICCFAWLAYIIINGLLLKNFGLSTYYFTSCFFLFTWESTRLDLLSAGYTLQEAFTRATAFVLKDSGVTLLKSNSVPDEFKKIDIEQKKNANGTPAKDANGKNIYSKTDCN